jgi:LacI family transcriptional regulator
MGKIMKLTIKTIADLANVSCTTVSRVLNNKPDVKPETRKYILELIESYNFQPSVFARGIHLKKSNCIGLIIPSEIDYILMNSFYAEVIRGIASELYERGYFLLFLYTNKREDFVNVYKQNRVDGFIIIRLGVYDRDIIATLNGIGAPFVSTAHISGETNMTVVDIDHYKAASKGVEYLISLGHKRIGMLAAANSLTNCKERFDAYKDVLRKYDIPFDDVLVEEADTSTQGGYNAMKRMLKNKIEPTAVFVAGDVMAKGAMKAIKEAGKSIPKDISVMGFDGVPESEFTEPSLTTIKQPSFSKGKTAASLLIDKLENKSAIESITMDVELIIRESTDNYKLGK